MQVVHAQGQEQVLMELGYEVLGQGQEDAVVPLEGLPAELPQQVERQEKEKLQAQTTTSRM